MVSLRIFLAISIVLTGFCCISGCKSSKPDKTEDRAEESDSLKILALERFVTSGMSGTFLPEFEKNSGIRVSVTTAGNSAELVQMLTAKDADFDLVLGLDNATAAIEDMSDLFQTSPSFDGMNKEVLFDRRQKLVPYAYGYLCLVYNPVQIPEPPESFGELQDPKFYNQLAICDPHEYGIGAAILQWSIALFGEQGYEHLWRSLRKNIIRVYPNWEETLSALNQGSCNMIIGFSSTPNWYQELDRNALPLQASILREGSFLYIETAAILAASEHKKSAELFIGELLSPETQQLTIYKLGLFPANTKTYLPMHFTSIPYSTYTVNSKLPEPRIRENYATWLKFWDRLFSYRIVQQFIKPGDYKA